jgi:thiol-disulfide isomerase/thioredoxin
MQRFFWLLLLIILFDNVHAQIDARLRLVETDEIVSMRDLVIQGEKGMPTFFITWSGEWCFPCMNVLESFGEAAASGIIKVVAVNVDGEEWATVKEKNYHKNRWGNITNTYVDTSLGGSFSSYFAIQSAPLSIYFDPNGSIQYMNTSYEIRAWMFADFFGKELIWNSATNLNSYAWRYFENNESSGTISSTDENMVKAIDFVKRSIELDKNYFNTDTYAALLYLSGQYTQALKVAKDAIDIAKTENEDYDSTNELIQKIIDKM